MSQKPIFVATHPRACSTAFERVFMTRPDILRCIHEPFGDAFYFGPERLSERYEHDEQGRLASGFSETTYQAVLDRIEKEAAEGKRVFIKDITHYLMPPKGAPASIAPSCLHPRKGVGTINEADGGVTSGNDDDVGVGHGYPYATAPEGNNPTVIPRSALEKFHFSFLIRHPRSSVPSYYRCTIPPLDAVTGFRQFLPEEMGYHELRRLFDYLRAEKMVGPRVAGRVSSGDDDVANGVVMDGSSSGDEINDDDNNNNGSIEICVIDADDLLDNPTGVIQAYCRSVGIPYDAKMLVWDDDASHEQARAAFAKWKGFHDDAIRSRSLRARVPPKSIRPANDDDEEQHYDREWTHKFGPEAAALIRRTVDENVRDYEYLKGFALKV